MCTTIQSFLYEYNSLISHQMFRRTYKYWILFVSQLFVGFFIVFREFSEDSAVKLTGACLASRGERLYVDFFEHHGPLVLTVVSWLYRVIRTCDSMAPRYFVYGLFCASLWLIYVYAKSFKTAYILLIFYVLLSVTYGTTILLSETWLVPTVLGAFTLLYFHRRLPVQTFWVLFSFVEASFFLESPLYIPCGIAVLAYFFFAGRYPRRVLLVAGLIPTMALLLYVGIGAYVRDVIMFNLVYNAKYTGPLWVIDYQYITQLVHSILQIFTTPQFWRYTYRFNALFEGFLMVTWIGSTMRLSTVKKNRYLYYFNIIIALLLFARPGNYHMLPFLFFLLVEVTYFLPMNRRGMAIMVILLLLGTRLYYSPSRYNFDNLYGGLVSYYRKIILQYTKSGDHILLFTGQKDDYLAADRMPGTSYYMFYPWVYDVPGASDQLMSDIASGKNALIIFDAAYLTPSSRKVRYIDRVYQYLSTDAAYRSVTLLNNGRMYVLVKK